MIETLGIKIDTQTSFTDVSIGLYGGELRWILNDFVGVSGNWKSGLLLRDGIDSIREGAEFLDGGAYAMPRGVQIDIDHTSRLYLVLEDLGIYLNGFLAEIYEFEKRGSGDVVSSLLYSGKTKVSRWNETLQQILVEPNSDNRNAFISKFVNLTDHPNATEDIIGRPIPVVMGTHAPDINSQGLFEVYRFAKFLRVANSEDVWSNDNIKDVISGSPVVPDPAGQKVFPIFTDTTSTTDPIKTYTIAIAKAAGSFDSDVFDGEDYHMLVVEGTGSGKYRRIESATRTGYLVVVVLSDYFTENLSGNGNATADSQSWVQFVKVNREYQSDVWPLKSYVDESGVEIDLRDPLHLYSFSESKKVVKNEDGDLTQTIEEKPREFLRLPEYAYVDSESDGNNNLDLDVKQFQDNPDRLSCFLISPVTEQGESPDNLFKYSNGLGESNTWRTYVLRHSPAFYLDEFTDPAAIEDWTITQFGSFDNVIDRNSKSSLTYIAVHPSGAPVTANVAWLLNFKLPSKPDGFEFDKVYLMLKLESVSEDNNNRADERYASQAQIRASRFIGNGISVLDPTTGNKYNDDIIGSFAGGAIDDSADFYFNDYPKNSNKFLYFNSDVSGSSAPEIFGYQRFEIPNIVKEGQYESLLDIGVILQYSWGCIDGIGLTVALYEAAIMFEKEISIKNDLFSPMKGRIYNNGWEGRRKGTDEILGVVDFYEHFCRLQNWSNVGDTTSEPGLEYSPVAKINKGSGAGGFESNSFVNLQSVDPAFVLTRESEMWTNNLKQEWCKTFFLAGYADPSGRESLEFLMQDVDDIVVSDEITLLDIPEGMSAGDFELRRPEDIYCEPVIRYNRNPANDDYQSIKRILNTHVGTWQQWYTPGIESGVGESLYNLANGLWKRARQVNPMPDEMTRKFMIKSDADAVWWLEAFLRWQYIPWIWVPVYYEKARRYHVGKFVSLNLPSQTNGETVKAFVGEYDKSFNNNMCNVRLYLLGTEPNSVFVSDSYSSVYTRWSDDYDTFTERGNTGLEDKEDIT